MEKDIKIKSETGIKGLSWDKARTKEVNMQDAWAFLKKKMGQQIINFIISTDRSNSLQRDSMMTCLQFRKSPVQI